VVNRVLEAICAAILATTVLIAFTAVIFRYVIGSALSWSFEASLALLTYLTFIGCYLALRKHSHLKVDVLVRMLPRLGQAIVFAVNQLLIAGIGAVMLYHGARQVLLYQSQNTLVMEIPVGVLSGCPHCACHRAAPLPARRAADGA
jgi:TRAP-type C4-dicarboxylate transport system permease small subunit